VAEVGNNWERVALRHSDGRDGWEDALFGCLKDVCSFYACVDLLANDTFSMLH
jgi:hypothetical protein